MDNVSQWQSSVQFSLKDRIYALGKAYMRSTPSLRSSPGVADETVPVLFWLTMAFSRPVKEERSPSAFLSLFLRLSLPGDRWWDVKNLSQLFLLQTSTAGHSGEESRLQLPSYPPPLSSPPDDLISQSIKRVSVSHVEPGSWPNWNFSFSIRRFAKSELRITNYVAEHVIKIQLSTKSSDLSPVQSILGYLRDSLSSKVRQSLVFNLLRMQFTLFPSKVFVCLIAFTAFVVAVLSFTRPLFPTQVIY